jgi:uncharacterized protein YqgC (DUF456 family)
MIYLWVFLLVATVIVAWLLTLLGMPGNWLIVLAVAVYVLLMPEDLRVSVSWGVVVVLIVFAALGELLEFLAGALGVAKAGGSRRGAVLALLGSIAGAVVGLFVGLPIPVIGSMVAAVLFAGAGAFVGAVLGEQWKGRQLGESCRVGHAAFWGRVLGTVAKTAVGAAMVAVTVVALLA